jgi:hypothetical protein
MAGISRSRTTADLRVPDWDGQNLAVGSGINDIRKTAVVVKNGIIYKPQELYSELEVAP